MEVSCGRSLSFFFPTVFFRLSPEEFYLFIFFLKRRFTAPSVLHAVDRAGEGGSGDDWQCAQQRERLSKGAGRVCRQETEQKSKDGEL